MNKKSQTCAKIRKNAQKSIVARNTKVWRESVFQTELMTGYSSPGNDPISRVTIGALEDLGYEVNYNAADNYSLNTLSSISVLNQSIAQSSSNNTLDIFNSSSEITESTFPNFNGNKYINHLETSLNIVNTPDSIKLEGEINWKSTNTIRFYEISTGENYLVELTGDFDKNDPAHTSQLKGTVNQIKFYKDKKRKRN